MLVIKADGDYHKLGVVIEKIRHQDGMFCPITPKVKAKVNYYLGTSWFPLHKLKDEEDLQE